MSQATYKTAALALSGIQNLWMLDEASGTSFADSKGSNNGATAASPSRVTGPDGSANAIDIAATANNVVLPGSSIALPESHTWFAWIKPTAAPASDAMLLEWATAAFAKTAQLDIGYPGTITGYSAGARGLLTNYYGTVAGANGCHIGDSDLGTGAWKFIAITFDNTAGSGEAMKVYLGSIGGTVSKVSSVSGLTNYAQSTGAPGSGTLGIGGRGQGGRSLPFNGALGGVGLVSGVLTTTDMNTLISAMGTQPRTATDTWAWSDTALHPVARTAADTWAWSDSVARLPSKGASDTWAWSDTTSRGTAGARTAGTERTIWAANEGGWSHYAFGAVCKTLTGRLVAVARRASSHGAYDGSLVVKRSSDDGGSWGSSIVVLNGALTGWDERDPDITCLSSGRLVITGGRRKSSSGYDIGSPPVFMYSDDEGATWTAGTANTQHGLYIAAAGDGKSGLVYGSEVVELDSPSHLLMFGYGAVSSTFNSRYQLFCSETTDGGATWSFKCYPATYADAGNYNAVEPQVVRLETGQLYLTWHRESSPQKWYSSTALTPYTSWSHTQQSGFSLNRQGLARMGGSGIIVSGVPDDGLSYWYIESRNGGSTFNSRTQVNPTTYDAGVTWPTWIMSIDLGGTGDTQNVGFIYCEEKASTQDNGSVKYRQFSGLNGSFVYTRGGTDAWAWSDSTSIQFSRSRTATDTWSWTDSPARSSTSSRTPADTWSWTDSTTGARGTGRTGADTWSWSDTATRTVTHALTRTAADTWAWSDTSVPTIGGALTGTPLKAPATASFVSARSHTAGFVSAKSQTADFIAGAT